MITLLRKLSLMLLPTLPVISLAAEMRQLTTECEVALALSAGPEHLRAGAGVYVLGSAGYERVRNSANGYECIVERNHPDSIIPQCFDASARAANLAVLLDEGKLLREGTSFAELLDHREQALAAGIYPVAGPGVAYMISNFNYIYNDGEQALLKVAPHVMFHAPHLNNSSIGATIPAAFANRGLPFMNAEGPHGFMVSFTEHSSDSKEVEQACANQLPQTANMVLFPPAR